MFILRQNPLARWQDFNALHQKYYYVKYKVCSVLPTLPKIIKYDIFCYEIFESGIAAKIR